MIYLSAQVITRPSLSPRRKAVEICLEFIGGFAEVV
jgi:hypothetical protein